MSPEPTTLGSSRLDVEIDRATPKPPDVPTEGLAPGNKLVPCAPVGTEAYEGANLVRRNELQLPFHAPQGQLLSLTRIHLYLPVSLKETDALEEIESHQEETTHFQTEGEAGDAVAGNGGQASSSTSTLSRLTPSTHYERVTTETSYRQIGTDAIAATTTIAERSLLPTQIKLYAAITSVDGIEWADAQEVPVAYASGVAGQGTGYGVLDTYADLTNPISIDPTRVYGLALAVQIPSTLETNVNLGGAGREGEISLFYNILASNVGK